MRTDHMWTRWAARAVMAVGALMVCSLASAQTGNIAGVVKDPTGGVLPGVTVEASSPALIEKVRVVTTDGAGQFKIVDLPIGVYKVTFTLVGFSSMSQEGIQLTTGFTATTNADLRPGSIEETITVSGSSPVVDVQNVATRQVMSRETMDSIPTGGFYTDYTILVPGMVGGGKDVGGTITNSKQTNAIHGGRELDQQTQFSGMGIGATHINNGAYSFLVIPDGDIEEINLTIGNLPAEVENGGVLQNMVPKTGGNTFHGSVTANYGSAALQSSNVDDELAAAGIPTNVGVKYNVLVGPSVGGPIKRDKLWFFTSYQQTRRVNYANGYYNLNLNAPGAAGFVYVPDLSRQAVGDHLGLGAIVGRGTYQVTPKNKITIGYEYNRWCECDGGSRTTSPEAAYRSQYPQYLAQGTWTAPVTNKLLFEAGFSSYRLHFLREQEPEALGPSTRDENGVTFRSPVASPSTAGNYNDEISYNRTFRASVSYVTGSHAFKAGLSVVPQGDDIYAYGLSDPRLTNPNTVCDRSPGPNCDGTYQITTLGGKPRNVTFLPLPLTFYDQVQRKAAFVQDQWTTHKLTINGGVRLDWFTGGYPGGSVHPSLFPNEQTYSETTIVNWKDLSPRLGLAYDVFGNGRTALKVGLSRYVNQYSNDLVRPNNPAWALAGNLTRTWNDSLACATCVSGDFIPQGDPLNPAANGELGPSPNAKWGQYAPVSQLDPEWGKGWFKRPYQWEMTAGLQHELMPQLSVSANYFRRWYGNFAAIDNTAVKASDYDEYCITTPTDSRLPDGGNQRLCGFFDLNSTAFGKLSNLQTSSAQYGKELEHWNGLDLTINARLASVLLQGGLSTGKTMTDTCDIVNKYHGKVQVPSSLSGASLNAIGALQDLSTSMCHLETPFLTQVKFLGSYLLPWQGLQVTATLQNAPGGQIISNYTARNADIKPSLGRDLSAGPTTSVGLNLVPPGVLYTERLNQVDLRIVKNFNLGGDRRLKAGVGMYNAFNANTILSVNNSYGTTGASWLVPQSILSARLVKFEGQLVF